MAIEITQVRAPERHAPHRVAGQFAGTDPGLRQRIVVGEERRQVRAQRDACRAGERGEIQDQIRVLLGRIAQRIAQHQAPFCIGVVHFHRHAGAGGDHFARAECIRAHRVLHCRNQQRQPHRQLLRHHQSGQRQGMRRAAHVLFHVAHAIGRLQIQPAGVEAHALADQHQMRMRRVAPLQLDQSRRAMRGAPHGMDGGEVLRQQRVADDRIDLCAMRLSQRACGLFQMLRAHVFGGRVDPVAYLQARLDQRTRLCRWRCSQFGRRARHLAITRKAIGAQSPAQMQQRLLGIAQRVGQHPAGGRR